MHHPRSAVASQLLSSLTTELVKASDIKPSSFPLHMDDVVLFVVYSGFVNQLVDALFLKCDLEFRSAASFHRPRSRKDAHGQALLIILKETVALVVFCVAIPPKVLCSIGNHR